jgi:transposase
MAGEYWLDDEAWAAIDALLPKVYPGARRKDDRRIISGIRPCGQTGPDARAADVGLGDATAA